MNECAPLLPTQQHDKKELLHNAESIGSKVLSSSDNDSYSIALGYLAMVVAATCFGLTSFMLRVVEKVYHMPSNQSFFINFFVAWLTLVPYIIFRIGISRVALLTKSQYFFISLRAIFGTTSGIFFVYAVRLAPVGDVAAAYNVCPAVTLILAAIFLKERIRRIDLFSLCLSAIGIYFITRVPSGSSEGFSRMYLLGITLAAFSGSMAASAYITIRHLKSEIHCFTPPFFFFITASLVGVLIGGVPTYAEFLGYGYGALIVVLSGVFQGVAQVFLSIGLQRCSAGPAILIRNLEVPFEYIMGVIFLSESPTLLQLFAAFLILTSTIILGIKKSK